MVDTEVFYGEEDYGKKPILGNISDDSVRGISECFCRVCLKSKKRGVRPETSKYSKYDDIWFDTKGPLTDHQYFLCPPNVFAYVFKSRTWGKPFLLDCLLRKSTIHRKKIRRKSDADKRIPL